MKLEEYIKHLQNLNDKYKDLTLEVVYGIDDEGNDFKRVNYMPSAGVYEDREFISASQLDDWGKQPSDINAVCIN